MNAAPCVSVILTMREMSVKLTPIDLLSVKLTLSRVADALMVVCLLTATVLPARIQNIHRQHRVHVVRCHSGPSATGAASTIVAIGRLARHSTAALMQ